MATKEHCFLCFDSLEAHLSNKGQEAPPPPLNSGKNALFVTWKKFGNLRGCIGTLDPVPFPQGLHEFAIKSGVNDSRFPKITLTEIQQLTACVSLLIEFESGFRWDDWQIGVHGIVLTFSSPAMRSYRAVFLPEVAPEQNWTKLECITALVKKTGFTGAVDAALLEDVQIERFLSSKNEATYREWIKSKAATAATKTSLTQ